MAKIHLLLILIILLFLSASCGDKKQSTPDEQLLHQLIGEYSKSFDQKDFEAFSNFCTEDMLFFTLDGQVFNQNSMVDFLTRILNHWNDMETSIQDLEINVDNNLAWARYRSSLSYTTENQSGVMRNLITVAFRKTELGWKISHYHMSTAY